MRNVLVLFGIGLWCISAKAAQNEIDLKSLYESTWRSYSETATPEEISQMKKEIEGAALETFDVRDRLSTVKTWELMGDRYAIGKNADGERVGIYDLSMPDLLDKKYFAGTVLASIGAGDLNLKSILDWILKALKGKGTLTKAEIKTVKALEDLSLKYGSQTNALPQDWWKSVKWKPTLQYAESNQAPAAFKFSDMDLAGMSKNEKKWNKKLAALDLEFARTFGIENGHNFFDWFEFKANSNGGYDVLFVGPDIQTKKDHLYLLIDLDQWDQSFKRGVTLYLVREAVKALFGLIPAGGVNLMLGAVVHRWFDLYQRQMVAHQKAFLELLNDAEVGDVTSPMVALSKEERFHSGTYLADFSTTRWGILKRLLGKKRDQWKKDIQIETQSTEDGRVWLEQHDYSQSIEGFWFSIASKKNDKDIFLLAQHALFSKRPISGFGYQDELLEISKRNIIEGLDMALQFITVPIPMGSTLVDAVFGFLVKNPVEDTQAWEARLAAYLRHCTCSGANWDAEINGIYRRRLNPFEFKRIEESNVIQKRRKDLGI